jgi:malonate decarboxylase beta subunit
MGIVARCADHLVISDIGRLAMSGPEVIEASHGVEEFDARDRALVWRTTGGKHRYLLGDADQLVADDIEAFRSAAIGALQTRRPMTLGALQAEHTLLADRLKAGLGIDDAVALWQRQGIANAAKVLDMDAASVGRLRPLQPSAEGVA